MRRRKRKTGERRVKVVCGSDGWECSSLRRSYFHSSIVFVLREENPVRASFACRNETAASLRRPPTQSVTGIPSDHYADESHSPEMGFPPRLPCPLYCLLASSVQPLQHYENKVHQHRNWETLVGTRAILACEQERREDAGLKQSKT